MYTTFNHIQKLKQIGVSLCAKGNTEVFLTRHAKTATANQDQSFSVLE
jgi:hypothetical protein